MKKTLQSAVMSAAFAFLLVSCNSATSKDDMQKELQKDAQNALKSESKKEENTGSSSAEPGDAMTVADAIKFIAAADANKGKEITIKGYPRGTTKPVSGQFMLYVSDKTGTGLAEENFACFFKEADREAVRKHKAGDMVTVTGNIVYNSGMVVIKNSKLTE